MQPTRIATLPLCWLLLLSSGCTESLPTGMRTEVTTRWDESLGAPASSVASMTEQASHKEEASQRVADELSYATIAEIRQQRGSILSGTELETTPTSESTINIAGEDRHKPDAFAKTLRTLTGVSQPSSGKTAETIEQGKANHSAIDADDDAKGLATLLRETAERLRTFGQNADSASAVATSQRRRALADLLDAEAASLDGPH